MTKSQITKSCFRFLHSFKGTSDAASIYTDPENRQLPIYKMLSLPARCTLVSQGNSADCKILQLQKPHDASFKGPHIPCIQHDDTASVRFLSSFLHLSFPINSYTCIAKSSVLHTATRTKLTGKLDNLFALESHFLDPTVIAEVLVLFEAALAKSPLTKESSWTESWVEISVPLRAVPARLILGVRRASAIALQQTNQH